MEPITAGALIAGGSAIIGSGLSVSGSSRAAKKVARMQIAWERQKAQNAHQWEVEDLKKAGLNPILSADSGGATAGSINPPMPDFSGYQSAGEAVGNAINSALQNSVAVKKNEADIDKIISDISVQSKQKDLIQAQVIKELASAKLIERQQAETAASAMLKTEQTHSIYVETKQKLMSYQTQVEILKEQLKQAKTKSQREELERKIHKYTWLIDFTTNQLSRIGNTGANLVNSGANAMRATNPLKL